MRLPARWVWGATALAGAAGLGLAGIGIAQPPALAQARACTSETGGAANALAEAQAFAQSLTPDERQKVVYPYDKASAAKWSNLPFGMVPRNGLAVGELSTDRQRAAQRLINAALSSCGTGLYNDIRAAETVLHRVNAERWNPKNYYVAFVGQPSVRDPWILQITGHHLAYNIAYNSPEVSATPLFDGVEPVRFSEGGRAFEPLAAQRAAMAALASGLTAVPSAKLEGTFRDVTRGPGRGGDTEFPLAYPTGSQGRGAAFTALTPDQQALALAAMRAWVDLPHASISNVLMSQYTDPAALAQTYVSVAGSPDLAAPGSYVRIDGPRVWIEFVVQPGATNPQEIHFHTIWRDKTADYGGAFKS